jgi:hypothetical protein
VGTDLQRYRPVAPNAGVMVDIDPDLRPGEWLKGQEYLGSLVTPGRWQVVTYVDEEAVRRIARGDRALFISDGLGGPALRLTVASIDRDASRTLGEPELASLFGGDVLVREKSGTLYPEHAVYRVCWTLTRLCRPPTHRGAGTWPSPGNGKCLRCASCGTPPRWLGVKPASRVACVVRAQPAKGSKRVRALPIATMTQFQRLPPAFKHRPLGADYGRLPMPLLQIASPTLQPGGSAKFETLPLQDLAQK